MALFGAKKGIIAVARAKQHDIPGVGVAIEKRKALILIILGPKRAK